MTLRRPRVSLTLLLALICVSAGALSRHTTGHVGAHGFQTPGSSAAAPHRRALLVGVSHYRRPGVDYLTDLNCEPDVLALRQVLLDKFQFKPEEIKLLTTREETTRDAILSAFKTFLITPAAPGDIIYFHYSGHGMQVLDDNGDEFDGLDETLVPSDFISLDDPSHNIRDDEIGVLLAELKKKGVSNVTLSFDSCFSGTVTRGGRMLVRGRGWQGPKPPINPRAPEEGAGGLFARGEMARQGYVVLSATRNDELALECEDDEGKAMGLFSYALVKALYEADSTTSYRDLFEHISAEVSRRSRDQHPQLEGDFDRALFQGTALPVEAYLPVQVEGGGRMTLPSGELQGTARGSRFALYRAGTKDFKSATPLAEAEVTHAELTTAQVELLPEYAGRVKPEELRGARAVERVRQYPSAALKVEAQALVQLQRGKEILAALDSLPLVDARAKEDERWDVRLRVTANARGGDEAGAEIVAERKDGSTVARVRNDDAAPRLLRRALDGEARWRAVKSLDNHDARASVELRLVPVEVALNGEGNVERVIGEKPSALHPVDGGEMQINEGEHVMIELRNRGEVDLYVTLLDLRADGTIGPLWPYPGLRVQENKVPADGRWRRLPLPFVFQIEKPFGPETFKAIATTEPADFSPLLDPETIKRDAATLGAARTPIGQLLLAASGQPGQRGITVVRLDPAAWATAEVNFNVTPRR